MDPNQVDVVENGAIVKVFLLEGALPWNAGSAILESAGPFWESYALTHAALGFVVDESQSKHVVELHATNYVGAFLPGVPPLPPTPAPVTLAPTALPTALPTSSHSYAPLTPPPTSGNGTHTLAPMPSPTNGTHSPSTPSPTEIVNGTGISGAWSEFSGGQEEGQGGGGGDGGAWRPFGAGNGTTDVTWDNAAAVRVTSGFDDSTWGSANYVGKITGLLFNDISGWANTYLEKHPAYQPLSVCGVSSSDGSFKAAGSVDSYDFVWAAFERLATNGVVFDQQIVLPPKRTDMCLFADGGVDAAELVSATGNEEAVEYYRSTGECVRRMAAAAAAGNSTYPGASCASSSGNVNGDGWAREGAVSVLLGLGSCLDGQDSAFLYHNETAYLRLPLPTGGNKTVGGAGGGRRSSWTSGDRNNGGTARLVRYAPEMPPRPPPPGGGPGDRTWIVYVAVALAAVGLAAAGARALYRRKWERMGHGRGGDGGGSGGGRGSLFSSSAGGGWRSGGGASSDFGDFDSVGGGYEGTLFPGDNYGSGSRRSNWRGGGRNPPGGGPMEAETVSLRKPLLDVSGLPPRDGGRAATARNRGVGAGRGEDSGGHGVGRTRGGGRQDGRLSAARADVSPPPFSRMIGTIGAGPPSEGAEKSGRGGGGKRRSGERGNERGQAMDDVDGVSFDEDDPFSGGGGGGGGGGRGGSLNKVSDQTEGDEVFC